MSQNRALFLTVFITYINNLLSDKQFGYRKNRSTELARTLFLENITSDGGQRMFDRCCFY